MNVLKTPVYLFLITIMIISQAQAYDIKIDEIFNKYEVNDGPGVAVLIIKDGAILHKKGYGMANIVNNRPISPYTNFRLASLSKQFTAMAIAILIEKGALSLEDNVKDILPSLPRYVKDIKVQHLIYHTSGLPDYDEICSKNTTQNKIKNKDVIKFLNQKNGLNFPAGSKYQYSNSGYVVLSSIVQKISGMAFPHFIKDYIFKPLQMESAFVYSGNLNSTSQATGYSKGRPYLVNDFNTCNFVYGDGGIYTSLDDIKKWTEALENSSLVRKLMMDTIFASGKTNDGKKTGYGFGWKISTFKEQPLYNHGGSWVGFRTFIGYVPRSKLWVVLLSNHQGFDIRFHALEILSHYL